MPDARPQLIMIVGEVEEKNRAAFQKLFDLIVDRLRRGKETVSAMLLENATPNDVLNVFRDEQWTYLVVAPSHFQYWRPPTNQLDLSRTSRRRAMILLADGESTPEYMDFLKEFAFRRDIPVHVVSLGTSDFAERPLGPLVRRTASQIVDIIRDDTSSDDRPPAPSNLTAARSDDAIIAMNFEERPQPNSLTMLITRRAETEVEQIYIPKAHALASDKTIAAAFPESISINAAAAERHPPPVPLSMPSPIASVVKWLILGVAASTLGVFLYRRDLADLMSPLVKLFGSTIPPAASVDLLQADPDNVELSAFGPPMCGRGETILIQALLHLPADQPAAYALAVAADPSAVRKAIQTLSIALRKGEKLEIDLEAEGCHIDEVRQTTIWRGEPIAIQFFAKVLRRRKKPIPVRITAMRSGIPVGSVRFTVPVQPNARKRPLELRGEHAKRFERAFVSYASEDRVSVLGFAQALNLAGIEIFQDVLSLEPGDRWEKRLYSEIDRSDLFVLFWSRAASQSKWVVAEAEYALRFYKESGRQSPVIRPFLLEGPPIPKIPASLKSIHFNDKFRYMILGAKAEAIARRGRPSPN